MNIVVIGAGAWGTAFALYCQRMGHVTTLLPRRVDHALSMASKQENETYLPGVDLGSNLQILTEPRPALLEADLLIFACPSKALRFACQQVREVLGSASRLQGVITLCKGLDPCSLQYPSECVEEELGAHYWVGALSGPNNAAEIAKGLPAAAVLGFSKDLDVDIASALQAALSSHTFRIYRSNDRRGVELGGALKNIYAIAAGICQGLGLGDNARSALLTRALREMVRLGVLWGGQEQTFYGLSGLGDLMATAHGPWSRNRSFGEALGHRKPVDEILKTSKGVVEGYAATAAFYEKSKLEKIEAPLLSSLYRILYEKEAAQSAMKNLMMRPVGCEVEDL